ncbi:hypothetical protein GGI43DRAFT_185132 [Trichoderma evansii]
MAALFYNRSENFKTVAPRAKLAEPGGGPLGVMLFNGSARSLVRRLAIPVKPEPVWIPPALGLHRPPRHRPTPLANLPAELHLRITEYIEAIEDVLSVGLACPPFRGIVRERLQEHFRLLFGRWANLQIVCMGEGVGIYDYPPGVFSDEELAAIRRQHEINNQRRAGAYIIGAEPRFYDFTKSHISNFQREPCLKHEIFRLRDYLAARRWCTSADMVDLGLRPRSDREFFPTDEPWILRNLTRKQFVRAEAIALNPEFIHGLDVDILGFGEVLLSRICWSLLPPLDIEDPTNICRGVWAGHRFDITTLARHQREAGEEDEWIDVSNEVAEEIAAIWGSNLGADWREFLCA